MTTDNVLVEVELPRLVYLRLRTLTAKGGQSVTALLIEHAYRMAHVTDERDAVIEMWTAGLTDAEIARATGWTNLRVSKARRGMGLLPNKRNRTNEPKDKN